MVIATNPRLERLRAAGMSKPIEARADLPIPYDECRQCVAYDHAHNPIGRFLVRAGDCLEMDTITWRGWFWNLRMMAEAGKTVFPQAELFGFDDPRPLSRIWRES
jgi:hypothetical protein